MLKCPERGIIMSTDSSREFPKIRILLVDDDKSTLLLLKKIIEREGYHVDAATSAPMAMQLIDRFKFHIVLTDIMMPEMDGLELLAAVKKRDPMIQVVMITAGATMSRTLTALELGASDFMMKPVDMEELLMVIRLCEAKVKRWRGILRAAGSNFKEKQKLSEEA